MDTQQQGAPADDTAQTKSPSAPPANGDSTADNGGVITMTPAQLQAAKNEAAADARRSMETERANKERVAKEKRDQDEAIAKGQFDQVQTQLTTERDQAITQRDAYATALQEIIDRRLKPLSPADLAWVKEVVPDDMPLNRRIIAVEAAIARITPAPTVPPGSPTDPKRAGHVDPVAEHERRKYGTNKQQ